MHYQEPEVHLNLNVRGLPLSATLEINERSNQMIAEGKKVYKLGLGQSPFPVPQPVVDELKLNAHQKDYLPVKGLPALRQAISEYYRRTQQLEYTSDDILIGPGSKELMFILQLAYYGDLVIPTPSWVSYEPQAHIIGRHVYWLPTSKENDWLLTPDELDKHCKKDPHKPRIVILNYPNNPTGKSYNAAQLRELAEVARKYRIVMLSDEIYGEVNHTGNHISIAKFYPEGTIISGGLSKWCGAGGWRLGTFAFPKSMRWLLEGMSVIASETFTSTSAPIQYAAVRAFKGGLEIEKYLMHSRRILRALGKYIYETMKDANIGVTYPDGGFYFLPDYCYYKEKLNAKGITTSAELCRRILDDTGVAFLPGSAFGRPENELTTRIAYVDFDGAKALSGSIQIEPHKELDEEFLRQYCPNVVIAIEKICDWIKSI